MRGMLFLCLLIIFISTIDGQGSMFQPMQDALPMQQVSFSTPTDFTPNNQFVGQNNINNGFQAQSPIQIPFPQCLSTELASIWLNPSTLQNLFQTKLQQEDSKLKQERVRNDGLNNSMYLMVDQLKQNKNG